MADAVIKPDLNDAKSLFHGKDARMTGEGALSNPQASNRYRPVNIQLTHLNVWTMPHISMFGAA